MLTFDTLHVLVADRQRDLLRSAQSARLNISRRRDARTARRLAVNRHAPSISAAPVAAPAA